MQGEWYVVEDIKSETGRAHSFAIGFTVQSGVPSLPITAVPSKAIELPTVRGALPSIDTAVAIASVRPSSRAATSRSAISNMVPA